MVTIDLTTPASAPATFLEGLPRRLALTLPELRLVAELAGNAPLPFDLVEPDTEGSGLSGRLGHNRDSAEQAAYAQALASLHDPADTLRRRGLVTDDGAEPGLLGAVGLLATPRLALDIDVAVGRSQVKAWHRHADGAVATLSTCDGIVFELAWLAAEQWTAELSRITAVPGDVPSGTSAVPAALDLPYSLVDSVGEALRAGRSDLVPVLVAQAAGGAVSDGRALDEAATSAAVAALHSESRGRLRILAAEVDREHTNDVGVVSWVLLSDGWHSITPRHDDGPRVVVRRVDPSDLATELAPVLVQVIA